MTDAAAVLAAIREARDDADALFDALYPADFERFRPQHATPTEVCVRAAAWLAKCERVLDVGSGAGRFCVVGALTTDASFTGVEQRAWLVDAARDVAARLGATRADFVHGDIRAVDWTRYDGFYLFNPFGENYLPHDERIDDEPELCQTRFDSDVAFVERALCVVPAGTRVVTWHGFGGLLDGYTCVRREQLRNTVLECLIKR